MAKTKTKTQNAVPATDPWQAQADLRTLAEAHAIKKDKKRHASAIQHAKSMLQAAQQPVQVPPPDGSLEGPVD